MGYAVGFQDGDDWRYHVREDRSGIVALPTWTTAERARSYIVEELEALFTPLSLDDEQVSIVAAMNGASVLLIDPKDSQDTRLIQPAPTPCEDTGSEEFA